MGWLVVGTIIIVPLMEIAVFVKVAGWVGLIPAIGLAVAAGVIGVALLRAQGFSTVARMRAALDRGEPPVREVFDGACLMVAGALLLLPGLVSDVLALLLLPPPIRAALRAWLGRHLRAGGVVVTGEGRTEVIEGDFRVVDDDPRKR